jgi:hypothetical protein
MVPAFQVDFDEFIEIFFRMNVHIRVGAQVIADSIGMAASQHGRWLQGYSAIMVSYPKIGVVAPISAPICRSSPFQWPRCRRLHRRSIFSMAPVSAFHGKYPGNLKDDILAEVQPLIFPVSLTPIVLASSAPRHAGHYIHGICAANTNGNIPRPPAFTVCESVPIIIPPGMRSFTRITCG